MTTTTSAHGPAASNVAPCPSPIESGTTTSTQTSDRRENGRLGVEWALPRVALAVALVISLAIRLWSLDWQLPWQFHPDEGHYTLKAMDLLGQGSLNPKYFRNPSLFTYLLLGEYRLLGFQHPKQDPDAATTDGLFRPPSGVAYVGRLNSALMGVATVGAVAWLGWRVLGAWGGVTSALFLGLAYIHVRDSHYATNDVPATLLLTLSVAASLSTLRRPTLRAYVLAGLLGGLATSTKYNAGLFVAPLVAAHLVVTIQAWNARRMAAPDGDNRPPPASLVVRASLPLALAALLALVAYLAGTPYTLLDLPKFLADFRTQASFVKEGWEGQVPQPPGVPYLLTLWAGIGPLMLALSVLGLWLLARRRPAEAVVLAAFPVTYLLIMLGNGLFFVRFALPIVPFLCVLAACGVVLLARLVGTPIGRPTVAPLIGAGLALAAVLQPAIDSARHNLLIARTDTRTLAADWALATVRPGEKLLVEEYTIRDRRDRAYGGPAWQLDTDELDVNKVSQSDPSAPLRGSHRYVMVSSFQYDRFSQGAGRSERQGVFYTTLDREWRLVAKFAPGRGNTPLPFDLEAFYTPFQNLGAYERPGPTIKVYERP